MKRHRNYFVGSAFLLSLIVLGVAEWQLRDAAAAQETVEAPRFEVDPLFPKTLPNDWLLGNAIGVAVDAQDHIWIVHRSDTVTANEAAAEGNAPVGTCCRRAP